MSVLGIQLSAHAGVYTSINTATDNQRGQVLASYVAPAAGYVTRIGGFMRQQAPATTRYAWLHVYSLDTNGEPLDLLGYTDRIPLGGTAMDVSGAIIWSDPALGGSASAIRLTPGQPFAVVVKAEAPIAGDVEVAALSDLTPQFRRTQATLNAPGSDPFGAHTVVTGPTLALYVDFSENLAPSVVLVAPLDGAVLNTTTPIFVADFTDPQNGSPIFDKLNSYELEVTRGSDGALMWGGAGAIFPATFDERADAELSRTYNGSALAPGTTVYRWRALVRDDAGLASNWSGFREFTVNALGQTDTATDGLPFGVVDTATNLIDFTGRWRHPTNLHMTQAQILVYRNGVLFRSSDLMTTNVTPPTWPATPGTAFTLSHTFTGLGTLPPGVYTYTIRGKASDGQWGPESSPGRAFVANNLPTTPSNLSPPSGSNSTTRPLVEWLIDDPDDHDVFGVDDDSELEIIRPDATVATITTTDWDPATGKGWWQATPAVFNQFGAYKIRVRGRDISAGLLGLGAWSNQISFSYLTGSLVTITNPTEDEVMTTSVPIVAWTVSSGTPIATTITLYAQANPSVPLKGQTILGAATTFQIPIGWLLSGAGVEVDVTVFTSLLTSYRSLRRQFTVLYAAPDPLQDVNATGVTERHDFLASPSSMLVSWKITDYPLNEFAGYVLRRREAGQPASAATVLRTLKTPGQNSWRDYWLKSRTLMIYGVSQLRRVGATILESPVVEVAAEINLAVPILCSAYDAATYRLPIAWLDSDYSMSTSIPSAKHVTWGSKNRPTGVNVPAENRSRRVKAGLTLRSDDRGHLYDHMADYEMMMNLGGPLCLRTERPEEQMFCEIEGEPEWQRGKVGTRKVVLNLVEIDFTPGESGGS